MVTGMGDLVSSTTCLHTKAVVEAREELPPFSTADMLDELGYAVIEAAAGEDAMRLVDGQKPFDLLVTDPLVANA